jgi:hypothetical protein
MLAPVWFCGASEYVEALALNLGLDSLQRALGWVVLDCDQPGIQVNVHIADTGQGIDSVTDCHDAVLARHSLNPDN